jgi:hypothetical protein
MSLFEPRSTAVRIEPVRTWTVGVWQATWDLIAPIGEWAADTAQKFGALLAALMGPAVFSAYAFAAWSLAGNLGWTDTFIFSNGPLSNWFLWLGLAIALNSAASILNRHTHREATGSRR